MFHQGFFIWFPSRQVSSDRDGAADRSSFLWARQSRTSRDKALEDARAIKRAWVRKQGNSGMQNLVAFSGIGAVRVPRGALYPIKLRRSSKKV